MICNRCGFTNCQCKIVIKEDPTKVIRLERIPYTTNEYLPCDCGALAHDAFGPRQGIPPDEGQTHKQGCKHSMPKTPYKVWSSDCPFQSYKAYQSGEKGLCKDCDAPEGEIHNQGCWRARAYFSCLDATKMPCACGATHNELHSPNCPDEQCPTCKGKLGISEKKGILCYCSALKRLAGFEANYILVGRPSLNRRIPHPGRTCPECYAIRGQIHRDDCSQETCPLCLPSTLAECGCIVEFYVTPTETRAPSENLTGGRHFSGSAGKNRSRGRAS